jgi:hypothetical protein
LAGVAAALAGIVAAGVADLASAGAAALRAPVCAEREDLVFALGSEAAVLGLAWIRMADSW